MERAKKVAMQLLYDKNWKTALQATAESGFRYVSVAFPNPETFQGDNWRDTIYAIREDLRAHNLQAVMTHSPYYDLFITAETLDPVLEKGLFCSIESTAILGAEICAVHPRTAFYGGEAHGDLHTCVDQEKSLQCNLDSFSVLATEAKKWGVLLGIENLMQYSHCPIPFYSCFHKDHIELIDKLQSDSVCAVWDFGHANLGNPDQASSIRALGSRIKGTHTHNNDGIQDEHFPPFLPNPTAHYIHRTVDWDAVLSAFRDIGYTGYLTLETSLYFHQPLTPFLQYLFQSVNRLDDILHGNN